MRPLPAIFALLVGAIGWYYLFYSRAAGRLGAIEDQPTNRVRGLLRRINAILMLLMAVGIALAMYKFNRPGTESLFVLTWTAIMLVLLFVVALALIDVRLTWRLRRSLKDRNKP
jgi:hypothetical protein